MASSRKTAWRSLTAVSLLCVSGLCAGLISGCGKDGNVAVNSFSSTTGTVEFAYDLSSKTAIDSNIESAQFIFNDNNGNCIDFTPIYNLENKASSGVLSVPNVTISAETVTLIYRDFSGVIVAFGSNDIDWQNATNQFFADVSTPDYCLNPSLLSVPTLNAVEKFPDKGTNEQVTMKVLYYKDADATPVTMDLAPLAQYAFTPSSIAKAVSAPYDRSGLSSTPGYFQGLEYGTATLSATLGGVFSEIGNPTLEYAVSKAGFDSIEAYSVTNPGLKTAKIYCPDYDLGNHDFTIDNETVAIKSDTVRVRANYVDDSGSTPNYSCDCTDKVTFKTSYKDGIFSHVINNDNSLTLTAIAPEVDPDPNYGTYATADVAVSYNLEKTTHLSSISFKSILCKANLDMNVDDLYVDGIKRNNLPEGNFLPTTATMTVSHLYGYYTFYADALTKTSSNIVNLCDDSNFLGEIVYADKAKSGTCDFSLDSFTGIRNLKYTSEALVGDNFDISIRVRLKDTDFVTAPYNVVVLSDVT